MNLGLSSAQKFYLGDQDVSKILLQNTEVFSSGPETWDVGITTTSTNQPFSVNIFSGISPDITVDWGDGTVETFTTIGVKTRTYVSAGSYTVKISGSFASGGNIRLGNTTAERARVQSTSVIPTILGLINFSQSFLNCSSLTSIPAGLFDNNTSVTTFFGTFFGCSSLTNIPSDLFDSNTSVTSFGGTFQNCSSLTTIPSDLFANNTSVTSFFNTFLGVTLTTTSYSNLLINMASNAASRNNNVPFHGGFSKYNTDGETAKSTLEAKFWSFTDGGLE